MKLKSHNKKINFLHRITGASFRNCRIALKFHDWDIGGAVYYICRGFLNKIDILKIYGSLNSLKRGRDHE